MVAAWSVSGASVGWTRVSGSVTQTGIPSAAAGRPMERVAVARNASMSALPVA